MKRWFLLTFVFLVSCFISGFSQNRKIPDHVRRAGPVKPVMIAEPLSDCMSSQVVDPLPAKPSSPGAVTVIPLGTSVNGLGWGFNGGQRTHIWADDSLKTIALIHRMGPGSSPPNLSNFMAVDKGVNMGQASSDWTLNWQIYTSDLYVGGNYLDMPRFPQMALLNSHGNSNPDNSYISYFAPLITTGSTLGNYTYGHVRWGNQADSGKNFSWFTPPPYHNAPDGFFISQHHKAYMVDVDINSSTGEYEGNLIVGTGILNEATHDFQFTYSLLPLASCTGFPPLHPRIASDPEDHYIWIACLGNIWPLYLMDSTYYPILFKSTDGGQSWSNPITVALDGPEGIPSIENFISDYRLGLFFYPYLLPSRDAVPYSADYSCDMVVDAWGNPHLGVGIHIATGNWTVSTMDSTYGIFHIYTCDLGFTWCGRWLGSPKHFRGGFPYSLGIYEDNRVNASISKDGTDVFFTWLDSQGSNDTANDHPDVFARGENLLYCMYTDYLGKDNATNITAGSAISQAAWFADASYYVFSESNGSYLLPVVTETVTGGNIAQNPVSYNYISNFKFTPADYTIPSGSGQAGDLCLQCVEQINEHPGKNTGLTTNLFPVPARNNVTLTVHSSESGLLILKIFNSLGKELTTRDTKIYSGQDFDFKLDVSDFTPGLYFYSVSLGKQKSSGKIIIE